MTIQVPYKLVTSPTQLLTLVPGRRKAIEVRSHDYYVATCVEILKWARARALHALYVEHMASASPCRRTTLTVGDIYMFLEDALHFPRPSRPTPGLGPEPKKRRREKDGTPVLAEEFCPTCGIKRRLHPGYDVKSEDNVAHWTCAVVPTVDQQYGRRFPLTNLAKALTWAGLEEAVQGLPLGSTPQALKIFLPPFQHTPRDLVTSSPPEFILAVHKVVSRLRLPAFPDFAPGENPASVTNREYTEQCLAPAALLSITLKPFISTLLHSAVEIAKRDATTIVPGTKDGRAKRTKKLTFVLTPGHILRGLRFQPLNSHRVVSNAARTAVSCDPLARESTALCLAHLGVRVDFGKDVLGTDEAGRNATVKAEPE